MWRYREIFLLSFGIAAALVPVVRLLAFRFGILDHPKAHGIHSHPVPRIGGIAIYIAFVSGSLFRMDLSTGLKGVLLASSMVFIIGVFDDLRHIRASLKLVWQVFACLIMMFKYGVILTVFPSMILNAFFTALGIIGLTNAVNFLDNMDGLSSGLIAISSLSIFVVGYSTGQIWLCYLSLALAGAAVGFLVFNIRKAYVFMGDAGSTFLGFTIASLCVMTEWSYYWTVTLSVPILILGVPILDMFLITVLRIKEHKVKNFKQWIDYTGKDHLSHRFMRLGLGERGAVAAIWALQLLFCVLAVLIQPRGLGYGVAGLGIYFLFLAGVIVAFRKKRHIVLKLNKRKRNKRSGKRGSSRETALVR